MDFFTKKSNELLPKLLLGILILVVFSFIRYVSEEIAPFFPMHDDQGYYLRAAHEYFDFAQRRGLLRLLKAHFFHDSASLGFYPASSLHLSLVTSFFFLFFGKSRVAALGISLLSWIGLLVVAGGAFKKLGRSWNYAGIIVGLLLSTGFGFLGAGGFADFRMDFPAACWFGMAVLTWCVFLQNPTAKSAGLASFFVFGCIFLRIISVMYWFPILGGLLIYIFLKRKNLPVNYSLAVVPLVVLFSMSTLLLLWDRVFIYNYFFVSHLNEAPIRTHALGLLPNTFQSIFYYPINLWKAHFGMHARMLALWTGLALFGLRINEKANFRNLLKNSSIRKDTFVFSVVTLVWPLFVLSVFPNRAFQVTSIAVPSLVVVLGLMIVNWTQDTLKKLPRFFHFISIGVLVLGFVFWEQQLVLSTPFQGQSRSDAFRYNEVLEKIALHNNRIATSANPPRLPQIAVLDWVHGFNHNSVTSYARERLGLPESFEMEIPRTIFKKTKEELIDSIAKADAIIIPKDFQHLKNNPWPIMQSIGENFTFLLKEVRTHRYLADEFNYGGRAYELFLSSENQDLSRSPK